MDKTIILHGGGEVKITHKAGEGFTFKFGGKVIKFWKKGPKFYAKIGRKEHVSTDLAELSALVFNNVTHLSDKIILRNILLKKYAKLDAKW